MPIVEVPDIGEIEFPDDMSQEDIVSAIKNLPKSGTLERPATMSALPDTGKLPTETLPEETNLMGGTQFAGTPSVFEQLSGKRPREALPAFAAAGATVGPGVVIPAITSGLGFTAGEAGRQKLEKGEVDLYDAAKGGLKTGVGTLAGGVVFKAIGSLANKIFAPKPLPKAAQRAAKFAQKEDLPFPLSSAAPGSRGAQLQTGVSMTTLPARIVTQSQAKKAAEFINRSLLDEIPQVAKQAKPIDQVARKGQLFFRNIIDPIKQAGEEGFIKFTEAVGNTTKIPFRALPNQINDALENLMRRGLVTQTNKGMLKSTNKLGKYLIALKESPVGVRTLDDYEVIRKKIAKLGATSETKTISDDLAEAIYRDYDEVGSALGVSARTLVDNARQKYAQMKKFIKEFPDIQFLSKDIDSEKWLNLVFDGKNAKALSVLRKDAPEMYRELADTWLAQKIKVHTKAETGILGKVLHGDSFRKWFESERKSLNGILGKQKTQVLDNFSRYAQAVEKGIKQAEGKPIDPLEGIARLGGEAAGMVTQPHIMIPGEVGAFVLAKGLSNPNSRLFKLFTKAPGPQFKAMAKLPLQVGSGTVARESDGSRD